jgi:thiamine-phosphate pyrophosphorylase
MDKKRLNVQAFKRSNRLYLITDRSVSGLSHIQMTRRAIYAGIKIIQLREKHMSRKDIYREAVGLRALTRRHKVTFIVNDYIDIALAVNADGVHLGQEDMPLEEARKIMSNGKIIGISTHGLSQAVRAEEAGADYIGFGPVFQTSTKDAGRPRGINALKKIRDRINIPIVAIGGITWENINEVLKAGADACAVASGILSGNIKLNTGNYLEAIKLNKY